MLVYSLPNDYDTETIRHSEKSLLSSLKNIVLENSTTVLISGVMITRILLKFICYLSMDVLFRNKERIEIRVFDRNLFRCVFTLRCR